MLAAIDPRACEEQPQACAAVRNVLEKDPTLVYINGKFVPRSEIAEPSPPPPPTPPPLFNVFSIPPPPPFPPTPSPPPPWYSHAEVCQPVVTAAEADVDVGSALERSVCVYVRSIQDERVRASKCFASIAPSPPPPPPVPTSRLAAIASGMLKRRVRQGGTNGPETDVPASSLNAYNLEAQAKQKEQIAFLEDLSNSNFELKQILGPVIDKIEGRRLWQRVEDHASHDLEDNILETTVFGRAPIQGVSIEDCQRLCAAIQNETIGACKAIAFARLTADPRDYTLRSCHLLKQVGGCTPQSFAGAIWSRRDTDSCTAPTEQDNPLCVQLASGRCVLFYAPPT